MFLQRPANISPQMWSWRLMSLADIVFSLVFSTVILHASGSCSTSRNSLSSGSVSTDSTDDDDRFADLKKSRTPSSLLHKQFIKLSAQLPNRSLPSKKTYIVSFWIATLFMTTCTLTVFSALETVRYISRLNYITLHLSVTCTINFWSD